MKKVNWEKIKLDDAFKKLRSSAIGLTDDEVDIRINNYGLNKISNKKKRNKILIFFDLFKNTSLILEMLTLIFASAYYLLTKDNIYLLIFVTAITFLNIIVNYLYLLRIENEVFNRYKLKESNIRVRRNGRVVHLSNEKIVIGDVIILQEGDVVPADSKIIKSHSLKVNESKLKGKIKEKNENDLIYANSLIVEGVVEALVYATSKKTKFARQVKFISHNKKDNLLVKNITKINIYQNYVSLILLLISIGYGLINQFDYIKLLYTMILVLVATTSESIFITSYILLNSKIKTLNKKDIKINNILSIDKVNYINKLLFNPKGLLISNELKVNKIYCDENYLRSKELLLEDNKELYNAMIICNNVDEEKNAVEKYLKSLNAKTVLENIIQTKTEETTIYTVNVINNNDVYIYKKGKLNELINMCNFILYGGDKIRLTSKIKEELASINNEMIREDLIIEVYAMKKISSMDNEKDNNFTLLGIVGFSKVNIKNSEENIKKMNGLDFIVLNEESIKETEKLAISYKLCNTDEIADCKKEYNLDSKVFANVNDSISKKIIKYYDNETTLFVNYDNDNGINISSKEKDVVCEELSLKSIINFINESKKIIKTVNDNITINIVLDIMKIIIVAYGLITETQILIYLLLSIILKYIFTLVIARK